MIGVAERGRRTAAALAALAWLPGSVRAHGGATTTGAHDLAAVVLFLLGVVAVGAGVSLERWRDIDRRSVDVAVLLGVVAVLAAPAVYWLG